MWLVVLFVGMALLHSNRMALPFSLNEISELGGWKISTKVTGYMLDSQLGGRGGGGVIYPLPKWQNRQIFFWCY